MKKVGRFSALLMGPRNRSTSAATTCKADKRQTQNAGLVFVLLRSGKFHHGVGQGRLGLQCGCNGENADPHIIIGDISVAAGAQKPGKQRGRNDGNAIEQAGGEDIQKTNAVPFFHGAILFFVGGQAGIDGQKGMKVVFRGVGLLRLFPGGCTHGSGLGAHGEDLADVLGQNIGAED